MGNEKKKMVKDELIATMAEKVENGTKRAAGEYLEAFVETVQEQLTAGDSVFLMGFGVFEAVQRAEKEGRNPKTGESLTIPATTVPKFKASKKLKELVSANS